MVLRSGKQQDSAAWESPTVCPQLKRDKVSFCLLSPSTSLEPRFTTAHSDPGVSSSKRAAT